MLLNSFKTSLILILNVEVFAIGSLSTFWKWGRREAHAQRELPIWDVEKSFFNIMRNGNNLLVQGLIDNIFGCFVFVRKHFKGWGQARPALARAEGPLPHILKFYRTNAKRTNMLSKPPWTSRLFLFLIMFKKFFRRFKLEVWFACALLPTSPFSKVDDEPIVKSLVQTAF